MVRCGGYANQTWGLHKISWWAADHKDIIPPHNYLDLHLLSTASFSPVESGLYLLTQNKSNQTILLCKCLHFSLPPTTI